MNFNNIRNVGYPQHNEDAVPRSFVDDMANSLKESTEKTIVDALTRVGKMLKNRKQLITASATHYGDLKKNTYQFTWGEQNKGLLFKRHDMFNGFLVPGSGRIKKIEVLETGLKLNTPDLTTSSDFIVYDLGLKRSFPMFTLVLIRHEQEPLDIGTLYFHFDTRFSNTFDDLVIVKNFKFNPVFEEEILRIVEAKDIINIRSEFDTEKINKYRVFIETKGYNLKNVDNEFFTYLATILIELDPLEEDD